MNVTQPPSSIFAPGDFCPRTSKIKDFLELANARSPREDWTSKGQTCILKRGVAAPRTRHSRIGFLQSLIYTRYFSGTLITREKELI